MTRSETEMPERAQDAPRPWHWFGLLAAGLAAIMALGAVTGFVIATVEDGMAEVSPRQWLVGAGLVALAGVLCWVCLWLARRIHGGDAHIPTREKRSRNMLLASAAIGVVTGFALAIGAPADGGMSEPFAMLTDSPLPPALAAGMTAFLLLVMPYLSWRWLCVIDEHERQAYQAGALAASYAFLLGAPSWWLLWRGSLAPEPDGVIIFMIFNLVFLVVWFWKKYR